MALLLLITRPTEPDIDTTTWSTMYDDPYHDIMFMPNNTANDTCRHRSGDFWTDMHCYNWWALPLLVFPVMTLFGNVLVILSVFRERCLQTATNYFIVNLAVADLLVAVIVMPFGVYYLFNAMWSLPAAVCDCYIAIDVTCSTSSIFNLVAISVDRYIAVTQPIEYAKHRSERRVWSMIALAWLVSAAIGLPIVWGLNDTPDRPEGECIFNNRDYVIYSSLASFYVPCIIMMFLYYKIFNAIRQRGKRQRKAKNTASSIASAISSNAAAVVIENVAQTRRLESIQGERATTTNTASGSNEDDENSDGTDMVGFVEEVNKARSTRFTLAAVVEETGLIMANLASSIPITDPNTTIDSGYSPSNLDGETRAEHSPPGSPGPSDRKGVKRPVLKKKLIPLSTTSVIATPRQRFRSAASVARFTIFKANRTSKDKSKNFAKKERKATQTLAIVLGVFLCCWGPFFTCSMVDAICYKMKYNFAPGMALFILTTWLGYMNSCVNPLIYTIFNPEFRKAFRKILHCGGT